VIGEAYMHDVAPPGNEAAVGVERQPSDPATLRDRKGDLVFTIEEIDAASDHIAEIKAFGGIPNRTLDQAIPCCKFLHLRLRVRTSCEALSIPVLVQMPGLLGEACGRDRSLHYPEET
jgi:hypothetical protein